MYQGAGQACVAFSLARAFYMSLRTQGVDSPPVPSTHFMYWNARRQEFAGQDPTTIPQPVDKGCFPRLAMMATQKLGFCASAVAPYNVMNINVSPPPCVYQKAFDQQGLQWYDIDTPGTSRSQVVAECLKVTPARPVVFGIPVDGAFEEVNSSEPIRSIDLNDIRGGHMLCVLEVLPNGDILFDNWWEDWGFNDGLGIMSAELFGSSIIRNVMAVLPVPTYSEED